MRHQPKPFYLALRRCALTALLTIAIGGGSFAYTTDELASFHRQAVNAGFSQALSDSRAGRGDTYYLTSIYLMGVLSGVEATGDAALLEQAMQVIDNEVAMARPHNHHGRSHLAWPPYDDSDGQLYTYQGVEPIARAAAVIMTNPSLRARYASKAQRYVDFVNDAAIQPWYVDFYGEAMPWFTNGTPGFNDKVWLIGDIATSLYLADPKPLYLKIAREAGQGFKDVLRAKGTGWIWKEGDIPIGSDTDGEPGSVGNQTGSGDTAHTNRAPLMMANMFKAGIVFSRGDMQRMANTLADTMWDGSTHPTIANYINGSNKPYRTRMTPGSNGFIFSGWAVLGEYSPKAQKMLTYMLEDIRSGNLNATSRANSDAYYKDAALTGHMLRNGGSVTTSQEPTPVPAPKPQPSTSTDSTKPPVAAKPPVISSGTVSSKPRKTDPATNKPSKPEPETAKAQPVITNLNVAAELPLDAVVRPSVQDAKTIHWRVLSRGQGAAVAGGGHAALAPGGFSVVQYEGMNLDLGRLGLAPGSYRVEAVAEADGVFSTTASADFVAVASALGDVNVFPNPWRVDQHAGHVITWDHITGDAEVKIFTVAGQLVKTLSANGTSAEWDLRNDAGDNVASGLYLYLVTNQRDKVRGKLAVIR